MSKAQSLLYREGTHGRSITLWHAAKARAEKKGLPFTVTVDFIKQRLDAGVCERTGLAFDLEQGRGRSDGRRALTPSLDRILPEDGYTEDNCQLVCWAYNALKATGSDFSAFVVAAAVVREHLTKTIHV